MCAASAIAPCGIPIRWLATCCRPFAATRCGVDIDYFKVINDRFGHEIGDRAIVHVANLARDCTRTSDLLARIGGEEFAMLLPETDLDHALVVAERLRCEVAKCPLAEVAHSATISIGVAEADEKMDGISDLMKAADQALYAAKRGGRNRVVCSVSKIAAPHMIPEDDCLTKAGSNFSALPQSAAAGPSRLRRAST